MNEMACRELGKAYSHKALEFLFEKAGGSQIELSDLEAYQASAISWLTASAFCLVLEKSGPEEAYRFLSLVTAGTSACVRLKGAPFMLTMSAQLEEITDGTGPEAASAAPPASGSGSCSCHLGATEECPVCPKALKLEYQSLVGYLISYLREVGEKTAKIEGFCAPCGRKHVDAVLSEIVKDGISPGPEPEVLKQQAVAIALQTATVFGVKSAPLTVQALRDRQGS